MGPPSSKKPRARRQGRAASPAPHSLLDPQAVYEALQFEVTQLHDYWKLYRDLYTDAEHVGVLSRAAQGAFGSLQEVLARSIVLAIGRLLDSERNRQQENLTLRRLPELLRAVGHPELVADVETRLAALREHSRAIVTRRHKRVGHSDLNVALGSLVLAPVTWPLIDRAAAMIRELMVSVEAAIRNRDVATSYEDIVLIGDGHDLVHALRMAEAHRECMRAKRGLPSPSR